jgi:hypothetical protein
MKGEASTDEDEEQPAKKRKTSANGKAVVIITAIQSSVTLNGEQINGNTQTGGRKANAPFKRVDPSKISSDVMIDNRYEAKVRVIDAFVPHADVA